MIEDLILRKHRRHVGEIPLAPVLDLLVVVIFFLILSSSFIDLTKQTLPPSAVSTITDPIAPPPIAPKLFAIQNEAGVRLFLRWGGIDPGQSSRQLALSGVSNEDESASQIETSSSEMMAEFSKKFPNEKSLQLGLSENLNYQQMVSVMDGAREHLQDLVLVSYREAEAFDRGTETVAVPPATK